MSLLWLCLKLYVLNYVYECFLKPEWHNVQLQKMNICNKICQSRVCFSSSVIVCRVTVQIINSAAVFDFWMGKSAINYFPTACACICMLPLPCATMSCDFPDGAHKWSSQWKPFSFDKSLPWQAPCLSPSVFAVSLITSTTIFKCTSSLQHALLLSLVYLSSCLL